MNSLAADVPIYAVVDRRSDGKLRIVSEFRDPDAAQQASLLLRWAGAVSEVVLITAVQTTGGS